MLIFCKKKAQYREWTLRHVNCLFQVLKTKLFIFTGNYFSHSHHGLSCRKNVSPLTFKLSHLVCDWNGSFTEQILDLFFFFHIGNQALDFIISLEEIIVGNLSPFQKDYSFSTFVKFSEKLIFLTPWYALIRMRIRW